MNASSQQPVRLSAWSRAKKELVDDWRLFLEEAARSKAMWRESLEKKSLRARFMEFCENVEKRLDWGFRKAAQLWKLVMG